MALKPGFFEHHDENCDLKLKYTNKLRFNDRAPTRAYFCKTHNQWCYEWPIKITVEFEDGTILTANY